MSEHESRERLMFNSTSKNQANSINHVDVVIAQLLLYTNALHEMSFEVANATNYSRDLLLFSCFS